ncbi:MAG: 3-phosphoshikimate 1-carboxyvinyltransferase [Clostridia bacterium]|nr:3-phosphoshikimate 1-carboxyvinyltransferase [Clostridia bacterium]
MKIRINPSKLCGSTEAPPSKSMAHRLLICAGLSKGESSISGVAPSEDMNATMDCLKALGAEIKYDGENAEIRGIDLNTSGAELPCRECGSTLRFFIPIALLTDKEIKFTGSERLYARNMSVYETICKEQNMQFELLKNGLTVCGRLKSGIYEVRGDISSQFISGLLFSLPLTSGNSEIRILPPVESRPYIDMTISALSSFGVKAEFTDENTIAVKGNQEYKAKELTVEGDYSNAAFFDALNLLGADVKVTGLNPESLQGDRVYKNLFKKIKNGAAEIDLSDCPDLGPVCMALAAECGGAKFTGTKRLRIKESDRCAAMADELLKFGAESKVYENEMTVFPSELKAPEEALSGHNDHRIVMALSCLLTKYGGEIEGAEAVSKSLPDFFTRLKKLGAEVTGI